MARKFNTKSIADASLPGTKIQTGTIPAAAINSVRITSVAYTSNVWSVLDDTAVSTAGGFIRITGAGFEPNSTVTVESVPASAVTYVSSTELRAQVPAAAAGSRHLYVVNTDGAVAIRVNGINYSAEPAWTTTSPLTSGLADLPISVQLSASSNSTVTYTLQAGSSLPAGLTLAANGLLSGTITGLSVETTYNFTVEATDLELQNTPRAFSITISVGDQYFNRVTSLISANTPAATFVSDASVNVFNVSVVGDVRPSGFGPYTPGYYSAYFDGTADNLTIPSNAVLAFGTGAYTVEFWVYLTSYVNASNRIMDLGQANGSFGVQINNSSTIVITKYGAADLTASSASFTLNTWNHIAVVRTSTSTNGTAYYLNGVNAGTITDNNDWTVVTTPRINGISGFSFDFAGYLSNLRIVKGTAVYTSNFTPSTTPLTAIANTSLLTCQSNRFIDNSTNNFTVTRNGDTAISGFDPFVPSTSFAGRGSGYFDGTGDYLSTAYNSAYNLGTGDYTLECWFYVTAGLGGTPMLMSMAAGTASTRSFYLYISATNLPTFGYYSDGTNATNLVSGTSVVGFTWYHIAVARQSGTTRMFLNGTQVASSAGQNAALYTNVSSVFEVGREAAFNGSYFTGYIAEVRVVKGTAVYTTAFTPPTAPLTAVANTSLLTLQNNQPTTNSMFLDSSTNAFNISRNGNATQGTFSPYGGGWSNYFDGNGDSLTYTGGSSVNFGTSDFTVELWVYMANTGTYSAFMRCDDSGSFVEFGYDWSATQLKFQTRSAAIATVTTSAVVANQWNHVAATRQGTSLKLFVNGVQVGTTTTDSTNFGSPTGSIRIGGSSFSATHGVNGYISNFRVIKGTAVYTSAFTPPTTPLTPIAGTSLLTCADNRFMDESINNFTLTRNGDVTVQRFNPFGAVTTTPISYSAYFDGTGDNLTVPASTELAPLTGDFTYECWAFPTSATTTYRAIFGIDNYAAGQPFRLYQNGLVFELWYTGSVSIGSSAITVNVWYHLAFTRQSGTIRFFVNGVQQGSDITSTLNYPSSIFRIGMDSAGTYPYIGYISNVRAIKGTAIYTANFTPPTAPLTAIAGTSLLTCHSAIFTDASTNASVITANGDAASRQFNPFGWTNTTTAYTPAVYGGSGYFDGTGDFLNFNGVTIGANPYTIEFWYYHTGTFAVAYGIFSTSNTNALSIRINNATTIAIDQQGVAQTTFTVPTMVANAWYHVAAVRNSSNSTTVYLNGVRSSTGAVTMSTNYNAASNYIARINNNYFPGYISDIRVLLGTALYTSNFAPPVAPLTALSNTVYLNSMTGASIYDSSMIAVSETVGDARINTSIVKFAGKSSISLDGTGDNLLMPTNPVFDFGTGDFTIEFWVYFNSLSSNRVLMERWSSGNAGGWQLYWRSTGTSMTFLVGASTVLLQDPNASRITTGQWYHIAVTRSGTTARMFVDGTQVVSASDSTSLNNSLPLSIGAQTSTSTNYFNGYMSDIRITRGVARYTANFTPATSPFIAR